MQRELAQEREEPYRWARVDGFKEKIGNMCPAAAAAAPPAH